MVSRFLTLAALALPLAVYAAPGVPLTPYLKQVDSFQSVNVRPHPRLLLTPDEQARVREACKSDIGKPYWEAVRKYVDTEKATPMIADPPDFKDGKWTIEEWRRIVNTGGDAQNHIMAAAFAWVVTHDPGDLAEAKRWTLGVAKWDPHGPSAIEGVDHSAQDVLHSLALSYDWLYDQWTPAERDELRTCIAERSKGLYKHLNPYIYDSWNNHAWFQTTALVEGGLALANEVPEADTWWRYGSKLYFTDYLPLGGRDGDWHEGTHYISYTLIFVYQFADALRTATGIDAYKIPWLQQVGYFRLYTHPPFSGGIKFNDNNFTGPDTWDRMTAYNAAKNTGDPTLQWYADAMRTAPPSNPIPALYTLITRDPSLPPKAPGKDLPLGVWYRDSGWVVMRTNLADSNDTQFGLKCGPHLAVKGEKGHDHPDQNGFLINSGGDQLAVDSGYYDWYGSPHHTNWEFTALAHNTILVDGQAQLIAPEKASKAVSFVSNNDGMDFVEGEAATAYPAGLLKSWRRQVLFIRPSTFVVRDVVKPTKPAKVTWLLHGPAEFTIKGQELQTSGAKSAMSVNIVEPAGLSIKQWGGFPANAQPERKKPGDFPDQWHVTAETPAAAGTSVGLAVYTVGPKDTLAVPSVKRAYSDGVESVTVGKGAGTTLCLYGNGTWKTDGYAGDAVAVAIKRSGKEPSSILLSHATFLRSAGEDTWASATPADVSGTCNRLGFTDLSVRLDAAAKVRFQAAKPKAVTVDGKKSAFAYDAKSRTVALSLSDGMHRIVLQ
jgi:hypothetical protein